MVGILGGNYRYLLNENIDNVHFFDYQGLCENPDLGLQILAELTGTRNRDEMLAFASRVRRVNIRDVNTDDIPVSLLNKVENLHDELKRNARNGLDLK